MVLSDSVFVSAALLVFMVLFRGFSFIVFLYGHNFTVVHSQPSHCIIFREKAVKVNEQELLSSKQQTDTVRDKLVNTVEHFVVKEPIFSLRRRTNTELQEREHWTDIHQVTQTNST